MCVYCVCVAFISHLCTARCYGKIVHKHICRTDTGQNAIFHTYNCLAYAANEEIFKILNNSTGAECVEMTHAFDLVIGHRKC